MVEKKSMLATGAAGLLAVAGLLLGGLTLSWIAGNLGLSAAAASQLVDAIDKGGWALAAVLAVLGGGISGAVIATIKSIAARVGKNAAVA